MERKKEKEEKKEKEMDKVKENKKTKQIKLIERRRVNIKKNEKKERSRYNKKKV